MTVAPPMPSPEELVADLRELLDVEEIDIGLYRGPRLKGGRGRVYGGQVIAQGLAAAMRSVEGKSAHSLHAYFMRAGSEDHPIIYRVLSDFDGGSFANRRIVAMQRGQPILNMTASFQRDEGGVTHQLDMPDVPPPEDLISERELVIRSGAELSEELAHWLLRPRPIELRPIHPRNYAAPDKRAPHDAYWFRVIAPIGDDPDMHRAVLAYATDMALLGTAMLPHGFHWQTHNVQTASLDHAVWLHEAPRVDDWLLYVTDSPWAGHARGFNRGSIYDRAGRLIASTAQEGLMRVREGKKG